VFNKLKRSKLVLYLALLTIFFILTEISFLIQRSGIYLGDFKLVASHLTIPVRILPGVIFFLGVQLFLHIAFLFFILMLTRFIAYNKNWNNDTVDKLGVGLWFFYIFTIILANCNYFPNAKFAEIINFIPPKLIHILLFICYGLSVLVFSLFFYGFYQFLQNRQITRGFVSVTAVALIGIALFNYYQDPIQTADAGTFAKPNIIIIGVDSLRPDYLAYFGNEENRTPHMDKFLKKSTVFAESLTPIARTYPSWVSILTGQHPKLSNVRTNLENPDSANLQETLPSILRREGYRTVFATDETRFSNIDQRFGFDQVVSPPIGFNDFLLGGVNDFPISNLLINTKLGKYLFPNSYGSRPVFAFYEPDTFLKLLQPIFATKRDKPLFLTVHFCLPHYPYAWADLPQKKVTREHYAKSLHRVDKQFADFIHLLKKANVLDHSIVILLSDHGEALEMFGDRITDPDLFIAGPNNPTKVIERFYPTSVSSEKVNQSGGHGTDVLGLKQYHNLLAIRANGTIPNQVKAVSGMVSLLDLKPTVLEFLHTSSQTSDGISQYPIVFGTQNAVLPRHLFIESDFSPEAIRTVHPEARKLLFEGIDYFMIDPKTTRIQVRDSMLNLIISSKQYADYYGDWVLALYPQKNKEMKPILVNLKTGQWTNDMSTVFAKHSPFEEMLNALRNFYGTDIFKIS